MNKAQEDLKTQQERDGSSSSRGGGGGGGGEHEFLYMTGRKLSVVQRSSAENKWKVGT